MLLPKFMMRLKREFHERCIRGMLSNSLLASFETILAHHFGNVSKSTIEKLSAKPLAKFDLKSLKLVSESIEDKTLIRKRV